MYQYADNSQIGYSMQLVGGIPASEGDGVLNDHTEEYTSQTANHDSLHHTRTDIASFKADWRIGADTLTSQTSFIHYDLYYVDDLDFSPDDTVDLGAGVSPSAGPWRVNIIARNVANAISQDFASAPPDPRFAAYAASPNRLRTIMISAEVKY
jgi:hypothetical protein